MSLKFKPLAPEEIAVKAGEIRQKDGQILQLQLVLHIKNRETCSIRLDEAVGTDRWQDTFVSHSSSPICTVSIFFPGYGWVSKSDCGENPMNSLSLKPAFSDAFKRACYKWGIGRELFFLPEIIVGPEAVTSPIIDPNTREIIGIYDRIEVVTFDVNEVTGHPDLVVLKNKNFRRGKRRGGCVRRGIGHARCRKVNGNFQVLAVPHRFFEKRAELAFDSLPSD